MAFEVESFIAAIQAEAIHRADRQVQVEIARAQRLGGQPDFSEIVSPGRVVARAIKMLDQIKEEQGRLPDDPYDLIKKIVNHRYGNGPKPSFDRSND